VGTRNQEEEPLPKCVVVGGRIGWCKIRKTTENTLESIAPHETVAVEVIVVVVAYQETIKDNRRQYASSGFVVFILSFQLNRVEPS